MWLVDQIITALFGAASSLPSEGDGEAGLIDSMTSVSVVDYVLAMLPGAIGSDAGVRDAVRSIIIGGTLYWYGRPSVIDGDIEAVVKGGADCSGATLSVLVSAGIITAEYANTIRTAELIGLRGVKVEKSDVRPGDVACYGTGHVAVVIGYPEDDGTVWVMSMSGGGETTFGNNPAAKAKILKYDYWSKFSKFVRLGSE